MSASMPTRRTALAVALLPFVAAERAAAQEQPMEDLLKFASDSVAKTGNYFERVRTNIANLLRPTDPALRAVMLADLRRIRRALAGLRNAQSQLFAGIDGYTRYARSAQATPAELTSRWAALNTSFEFVFTRVNAIVGDVQSARNLDNATDPELVADLERILAARAGILAQLRLMPAPRTEAQLAALARLSARYRELHQQLGGVIRELQRAERRLD